MKRRAFLRGFGALLAAPAIVRASTLMAISPLPAVYGRSPGMNVLEDIRYLEAMSRQMASTIFYGDGVLTPMQFKGLTIHDWRYVAKLSKIEGSWDALAGRVVSP